jgi:predicted nuclease of predicted toxin-antitoxin system
MSQLFARLYLDEDVSVLLAALLRSRGFEAVTTHEAGNAGASDERQLAYAAEKGLAMLTHNRSDFEQLATQYFKGGRHHAGIIIAVRRIPHDILRRLLKLLNQTAADEIADNVWYV